MLLNYSHVVYVVVALLWCKSVGKFFSVHIWIDCHGWKWWFHSCLTSLLLIFPNKIEKSRSPLNKKQTSRINTALLIRYLPNQKVTNENTNKAILPYVKVKIECFSRILKKNETTAVFKKLTKVVSQSCSKTILPWLHQVYIKEHAVVIQDMWGKPKGWCWQDWRSTFYEQNKRIWKVSCFGAFWLHHILFEDIMGLASIQFYSTREMRGAITIYKIHDNFKKDDSIKNIQNMIASVSEIKDNQIITFNQLVHT